MLLNVGGWVNRHEAERRLSWDEMKQMDPSLIEIGSHGLSHQILTMMPPAEKSSFLARGAGGAVR